ncbi:hypothetical protein MAPG_07311 [Magnaporthiopsis poae ATCC 64411]|uniref:Uncharacterized protein n=1 Tax=Magnaporthiopsis poae (strain ATCC 64411 / 73-15) TaxID=644358 RepID=A0A0C4E4B9_MAGP6|nr:hypothetical protein MAPG_07311 [Magnaporthiopsis poae ATCC 64411]
MKGFSRGCDVWQVKQAAKAHTQVSNQGEKGVLQTEQVPFYIPRPRTNYIIRKDCPSGCSGFHESRGLDGVASFGLACVRVAFRKRRPFLLTCIMYIAKTRHTYAIVPLFSGNKEWGKAVEEGRKEENNTERFNSFRCNLSTNLHADTHSTPHPALGFDIPHPVIHSSSYSSTTTDKLPDRPRANLGAGSGGEKRARFGPGCRRLTDEAASGGGCAEVGITTGLSVHAGDISGFRLLYILDRPASNGSNWMEGFDNTCCTVRPLCRSINGAVLAF